MRRGIDLFASRGRCSLRKRAWPDATVPLVTNEFKNCSGVRAVCFGVAVGFVFAAMLLGIGILKRAGHETRTAQNTPSLGVCRTLLRGALWICCLVFEWQLLGHKPGGWPFWSLHGGAGIAGTLAVLVMIWKPQNPQYPKRNRNLYVGVILTSWRSGRAAYFRAKRCILYKESEIRGQEDRKLQSE